MEKKDFILNEIATYGFFTIHKDNAEVMKSKDELEARGLIYKCSKSMYKLTKLGYDAIEFGSYEKWKDVNKQNNQFIGNIKDSNIIVGDKNKLILTSEKKDSQGVIANFLSVFSLIIAYFGIKY